jgi:hypothetical protein
LSLPLVFFKDESIPSDGIGQLVNTTYAILKGLPSTCTTPPMAAGLSSRMTSNRPGEPSTTNVLSETTSPL